MTKINIGETGWNNEEIIESIPEFLEVYQNRPIRDNDGGMKSPHMFATWFMVKKLAPEFIIESGVWKGQSTWLLEQAAPKAKILSLDPRLNNRVYISDKSTYTTEDISRIELTDLPTKTLAFFDDHQDVYQRLILCKWLGIKDIIFEDNYPAGYGDSYSLKKIFANAGHTPDEDPNRRSFKYRISEKIRYYANLIYLRHLVPVNSMNYVKANQADSRNVLKNIEKYFEFPPVFKTHKTRFGKEWTDSEFPTNPALYPRNDIDKDSVFLKDAESYTWICYVKLKD